MYKNSEVVMLPTKNATGLWILGDRLFFSIIDKVREDGEGQHLYVFKKTALNLEDVAKEVCIFKSANGMITTLAGGNKGLVKGLGSYHKILGTTDNIVLSYGFAFSVNIVPKLPTHFIEEYCSRHNTNNKITEVNVVLEEISRSTTCNHSGTSIHKQGFRAFCVQCDGYLDDTFKRPKLIGNTIIIQDEKPKVFNESDLQAYGQFLLDGINDMFGEKMKFSVTPQSLQKWQAEGNQVTLNKTT